MRGSEAKVVVCFRFEGTVCPMAGYLNIVIQAMLSLIIRPDFKGQILLLPVTAKLFANVLLCSLLSGFSVGHKSALPEALCWHVERRPGGGRC